MEKRIAQSLTPRRDLERLEEEYNKWMNSVKEIWQEWEKTRKALEIQFGNNFPAFDTALKELSRRPKYKEFCRKLDHFAEARRELIRQCRLSEQPGDSSDSWAWMIKDSISPKGGRPGHPFHLKTKHTHFQEGPGVKKQERPRRGSVIKL